MKILVTGGAGFIGSHVVDHFIDAGHELAVVDNLSSGKRENINPKASFHEVDIGSERLEDVFEHEKPDVVDHLAAQMDVTRSVTDPRFDAMTNVVGIINVLERCVAHGIKRLIFSSTGGAIYGSAKDYPATEQTAPEPLSPYAVSKFAGEEYIKLYHRIHGLDYVILRYTNVFGPRQAAHGECGVCAVLTELMLAGKQPVLYGFGEPTRDYVYVGDVARANVAVLDAGDNNTFNICSGKPTTVLEIFEALKEITAFEQEPLLKPLRPGEAERSLCTHDKATQVLGWQPKVGLLEGLRATVESKTA